MKPQILPLVACFVALVSGSAYAQHGPYFIENKGQWDSKAYFQAELPGARMFADASSFTWVMYDAEAWHALHHLDNRITESAPKGVGHHAWRVTFEGGHSIPKGEHPQNWKRNYLKGNDPKKYGRGCQAFDALRYEDIAPGVDLYLRSFSGSLKYDLLLEPGASPKGIQLTYEGLDSARLSGGLLRLYTSQGTIMEEIPEAWQEGPEGRIPVACNWKLENLGDGNYRAGFDFPEGLDPTLPTVIDPVLLMCTYTGSTAENFGSCATGDTLGYLYGAGLVYGIGYPTSLGAFQTTYQPGPDFYDGDIALTKFSLDGSSLVWSTYLGGGHQETVSSIKANDDGELFVYGFSASTDMPVSPGCFQSTLGGVTDGYLAILDANGSNLLGGTYFGGSDIDGGFGTAGYQGSELWLGKGDTLYVCGFTESLDFPTTPGALMTSPGLNGDGYLVKFPPSLSAPSFSTYFSGNNFEIISSLRVLPDGKIFFGGTTLSDDLPFTQEPFHPSVSGGYYDGIVGILSGDGTQLIELTHLGGPNSDGVNLVTLGPNNELYVTGFLRSTNFTVSPGVYTNPGGKHCLIRYHPDLTIDKLTLVGGGGLFYDLAITAFELDRCGNVYLAGFDNGSNSNEFTQLPTTPDAFQATSNGEDYYLMALTPDFSSLRFGTFFGGPSTNDHSHALNNFIDSKGVLYQADCASCSGLGGVPDLPTTPNAWATSSGAMGQSYGCNMAVFKIDFQLWDMEASISPVTDTTVCVGEEFSLEENSNGGLTFTWYFGDGQMGVGDSLSHAWAQAGTYEVMMVAEDLANCTPYDTAYLNILVLPNPMVSASPSDSLCFGQSFQLQAQGAFSYTWTPASPLSNPNIPNPLATPAIPTDFIVTGTDAAGCFASDTVHLEVVPTAVAFASPDTQVCRWTSLDLDVSGGQHFVWSTGSTDSTLHWVASGTDTLWVTAWNAFCPGTTDSILISLFPNEPEASFTQDPTDGYVPTLVQFMDGSVHATTWNWNFGDGTESMESSPSHEYSQPGTFPVTLIVTNDFGCKDTLRFEFIEISPDLALFVPTAFTPNQDNLNDQFEIKGYGIRSLSIQIYDRWGKLIFESGQAGFSWDGTLGGADLPEGTYLYTVHVEGFDPVVTKVRSGTVTLIR